MARPSFKPTAAQRRKVSIAAGGGMSHESIAVALGISRPTLDKHFAAELSKAAYERRMEALEGMHKAAKRGNVSAARSYLANSPEFTPLPPETPQVTAAPAPAPAVKLGKKEVADAAAKTAQAGTGWAGLLPGGTLQ